MAMIKCPECGKEISDKSEMCVGCGYLLKQNLRQKEKRKTKKAPIIIICIVIFLIAMVIGSYCYVMYMNDWDFDEVSNTIVNKNYSCILGHDWQEATCTTAKKCLVCGYMIGNPLGHTWREATCTEPKTCTTCWITEGKALGHSTRMGTCTRCNNVISELDEEWTKIVNDIQDDVFPELTDAALNLQYASIYSGITKVNYVINSIECCRNASEKIDDIYNYAKKYKEFSTMSDYLKKAKESIPIYPNGGTVSESNCGTYAQEIVDGCKKALDYLQKAAEYNFK